MRIDSPTQTGAVYPFGYFALLAAWIQAVSWVKPGVVATFFGARIFSVVLLSISLLSSYGTLRLLGAGRRMGLLLLACLAFFPLTFFVGSYVQSDNLAFTLASVSFYLSLQVRGAAGAGWTALLGMALGCLLVTKPHTWLCVAAATGSMALVETAHRVPRSGRPARLALLAAPSVVLGACYWYTLQGTPNLFLAATFENRSWMDFLGLFRKAALDYYQGVTHASFWGVFGWLDAPLVIGSPWATGKIQDVIQACTWLLLALSALRILQVLWRLVRLSRRGRSRTALRIAVSNPVVNSYFLFTLLMFYLYVRTENMFFAQGRNWLAFMLPIFLVPLTYAPRRCPGEWPGGARRALDRRAVGLLPGWQLRGPGDDHEAVLRGPRRHARRKACDSHRSQPDA